MPANSETGFDRVKDCSLLVPVTNIVYAAACQSFNPSKCQLA